MKNPRKSLVHVAGRKPNSYGIHSGIQTSTCMTLLGGQSPRHCAVTPSRHYNDDDDDDDNDDNDNDDFLYPGICHHRWFSNENCQQSSFKN